MKLLFIKYTIVSILGEQSSSIKSVQLGSKYRTSPVFRSWGFSPIAKWSSIWTIIWIPYKNSLLFKWWFEYWTAIQMVLLVECSLFGSPPNKAKGVLFFSLIIYLLKRCNFFIRMCIRRRFWRSFWTSTTSGWRILINFWKKKKSELNTAKKLAKGILILEYQNILLGRCIRNK